MRKKILSVMLFVILLTPMFAVFPVAFADLEEDIEQAIVDGLAWLAGQQNPDGSWGVSDKTARTGFALIKLQDRAYELGYESPFVAGYEYSSKVISGWNYIFNALGPRAYSQAIGLQDHTGGASGTSDDPDTNGNGIGIFFGPEHPTYTTGICLMALRASGTPGRSTGFDFDGVGGVDSFFDVAEDAADWLAFAQGDLGNDEGAWGYEKLDNEGDAEPSQGWYWTDNSNSGYAVLGLAAAQAWGCTVPDWVKTELDVFIDLIQDPVDGDADDGGSWYNPDYPSPAAPYPWVNELKTGNLIFEMTFYGDDPSEARFQDALDYMVRHWQDANQDPGWGYGLAHSHYQAMFCLMKGFEYSQIELIDLDGDDVPEHDWYAEFAQAIVDQQTMGGYWTGGMWGDDMLDTCWALLTLEKITPPPPTVAVSVDIKPGSWPNPFNKKAKGVFAVAICGSEDFDVTTIDPGTVELALSLEEGAATAAPVRWTYEDVATPYEDTTPDDPDGHELGGDGYLDLVFHFDRQEVVGLGLCEFGDGEYVKLYVVGNLYGENGEGTSIQGFDWIRVQFKEGKGKE